MNARIHNEPVIAMVWFSLVWWVVNFQACAVNACMSDRNVAEFHSGWSKLANFAFLEGKHTSWKLCIERGTSKGYSTVSTAEIKR